MNDFIEQILADPVWGKIIIVVAGLFIINLFVRTVQRTLATRITDKQASFSLRRGISFVGYLAIAVFIASVYNDQLGNFTVALGVAGAGIAFALQEVIISVAGWIAISFGQFYKIGDRIQLGSIKGDVIDVGVLRTTLMEIGEWVKGDNYSGRIVRIANSFVFKEPVFNYSGDFPFLWDEIVVPIKYGSDYALMQKVLLEIVTDIVGEYTKAAKKTWRVMVKKYAIEEASVDPMVSLVANDNWVEFTVRFVVDYKRRRGTKNEMFIRILKAVEESEGKIAIASTTFHLVEAPAITVRVDAGKT